MQAIDAPARADIEYSDEEALLARSAAEFLDKRSDFAAVRAAMATPAGYDRALYEDMARLGWLGLALPGAHGGADMPVSALATLAEAMGRHLLASPFLASTLAAQALLHAGNPRQQAWLGPIARGEAIAALALIEPSGSSELASIAAQATDTKGGFELRGQKMRVLDAQNADVVLIALRRAGKLGLMLATRAQLAGRMRDEVLIDETRRSARIHLDGLSLGREALLDGGDAALALAHVQRVAWLLLAAEMAGGAEGAMQLTLEYLKTRTQFGKPIGSYQALKHPMVEIMCAIEHGRSLLYHAATLFDRSDPEREIALRMAKAQLAETYAYAVDRSIQFHGAIGFTYECHAQLFFRRAQWAQSSFGDVAHHRRHLAELLWPRGG